MPEQEASVHVENIGGIAQTDIELPPGVTVLSGPNATNRSSLIDALAAALGGSRATPQVGSDGGTVRLAFGDKEYTRQVTTSENAQVHMRGSPLVSDADLIDLYVSLDAGNPIRQAIERAASLEEVSDSLREMLMTPVDDEEIRSELQRLHARRNEVVSELDDIQEQKERLPALEQKRSELQEEIEQVETDLSAKRAEMESMEVGKEQSEEAEALLDELEQAERTEQRLKEKLEDAEESLELAREERDEIEPEVDELAADLDGGADTSAKRLDELRQEKNRLQDMVGVLMTVVRTSREILEDTGPVPPELQASPARRQEDVLEELTEESHVECWACGTAVAEQKLESRVEEIADTASSYRADIQEIDEEIATVREQVEDRTRREERLENLRVRLTNQQETVERYEQRVKEYRERLADQQETVADLREQVEETEDLRNHEVLDVHDDIRGLSREQGRAERALETVEEDISNIEARTEAEDELEDELASLDEAIEDTHGRVERLEKRAVTTLQEHLDTLLEQLEYENIARVRVDRVVLDDESQSRFEITVVRDGAEGFREDPHGLQSLSESERSLIALLVAFAGYQTHDIADEVPFILLDSIEEFDAGRIATLLEYIADGVEWVVCALLPEDASGFSYKTVDAGQLTAG
jgi:chromosome segregation ATPase